MNKTIKDLEAGDIFYASVGALSGFYVSLGRQGDEYSARELSTDLTLGLETPAFSFDGNKEVNHIGSLNPIGFPSELLDKIIDGLNCLYSNGDGELHTASRVVGAVDAFSDGYDDGYVYVITSSKVGCYLLYTDCITQQQVHARLSYNPQGEKKWGMYREVNRKRNA